MLTPERYEHLRVWLRALVDQQLSALAGALERGDTLWFAPEGAVTLDGKLMRLRGGLHTLLARARPDVRCLPANCTYDFMTTRRRITACIGVGPELPGLPALDRPHLSERVAPAITRQTVITMSQLGSACLLGHLNEQRLEFDPEAELPSLVAEATRYASLGAWVQRDLLTERGLRRRLRAFVAYGVRHHLLLPNGDGKYLIAGQIILGARSSTFWENPLRYSANELAALEAVLQPAPAPTPNPQSVAAALQAAGAHAASWGEAAPPADAAPAEE